MKAQITIRIVLIAFFILICYSNKGDNKQLNMPLSSITILNKNASCIKKTFEMSDSSSSQECPTLCCIFCTSENENPAIPEPTYEHEFHTFHMKNKAQRHFGFLKTIANKILQAVYYIVVLVAVIPFKH